MQIDFPQASLREAVDRFGVACGAEAVHAGVGRGRYPLCPVLLFDVRLPLILGEQPVAYAAVFVHRGAHYRFTLIDFTQIFVQKLCAVFCVNFRNVCLPPEATAPLPPRIWDLPPLPAPDAPRVRQRLWC